MHLDLNFVLAAVSILLFAGFLAFFGFLMFHQQSLEPKEKTGAELIEQHYAAGETIEQPTPYYVAPIPAAPDPLEISANLDRKILIGAGMLFAVFALVGGYFFTLFVVRADASSERWRDKVASQQQLEKSIERGRNLYANFCFDCHGKTGLGSTDPTRKDLPGLPLNKPAFKYDNVKTDPTKLKATQDLITLTIERGRAKPPGSISMPAWSDTVRGGGHPRPRANPANPRSADRQSARPAAHPEQPAGGVRDLPQLRPEHAEHAADGAKPWPLRHAGPVERREQGEEGGRRFR